MASITDVHPEPYIHYPAGTHKHTLILLHGTSKTGPEFAAALLNFEFSYPPPLCSPTSHSPLTSPQLPSKTNKTTLTTILPNLLPTTKFIFPTGSQKPTTVFGGAITHAWFDIHDFGDRTKGEEDQVRGMRESCSYLEGLVRSEEKLLHRGEKRSKVAVLGFSQGCAMGVIMMLSGLLDSDPALGENSEKKDVERGASSSIPFIGLSGWLPFRLQIEDIISQNGSVRDYIRSLLQLSPLPSHPSSTTQTHPPSTPPQPPSTTQTCPPPDPPPHRSPNPPQNPRPQPNPKHETYLAHGALDTKVKLEWALQMVETLNKVEEVEGKVYEGLAHWFNGDEICGVMEFLGRVWGLELPRPEDSLLGSEEGNVVIVEGERSRI